MTKFSAEHDYSGGATIKLNGEVVANVQKFNSKQGLVGGVTVDFIVNACNHYQNHIRSINSAVENAKVAK